MSLYSALYAGVSGLSAQSNAMATVADNITNVNTVGYKAVIADFSTLVGGGGQAGSAGYAAGGVQSIAKQTISQNGLLQAASRSTDLGIDGNGFFVVRNGTGADSQMAYTRAGAFTPDKNGDLVNTGGYYLQGWPISANGTVSNNPNDMRAVNILSLSGVAEATSTATLSFNLQSTTTAIAGPYTPGDMATYAADPNAAPPVGIAPQFTRAFDVYDQQGNAHQVNIGFVKTGTNAWQVEVYGNSAELDPSIVNGVLASGKVAFNPDGTIDLAGTDAGLLNTAGTGFKDLTPQWVNGAGANPINLNLGITQNSNAFAQGATSINGGLLGDVTDVGVSKDGVVSAVFANGSTRPIYQLPLATFANPDGLTAIAGNAYLPSDRSGNVAVNAAGTQGTGQLASKQLEQSTADIATEFTNMIRFQRAYSASSKIITTVDQMLQELGALKN